MTRTRRPAGNCVAWVLLFTQLIPAPTLYCCAFHPPVATSRRRHRPHHGGCLPTASHCCPTTTRSTRACRANGRISRDATDKNAGGTAPVAVPVPRRRPALVTPLFLSASEDAEKDATPEAAADAVEPATAGGADLVEEDDDEVSSSGVTRTLLLAVPLFCKFVLVLMIKFVTDLIVYPLLLLYRGARITKRKVLRIIKGGSESSGRRDSVNGEKQ